MPSKAGSDSNQPPERKQEHRYSDEDLKILQQHDAHAQQQQRYHHQSAYEQPVRSTPPRRPAGPRSAGRSSRRPSDSPSILSSFSDQSSSHSHSSNPIKPAIGVAHSAIQPALHPRDRLQEPSRKPSKSFSLRSEPSSVALPPVSSSVSPSEFTTQLKYIHHQCSCPLVHPPCQRQAGTLILFRYHAYLLHLDPRANQNRSLMAAHLTGQTTERTHPYRHPRHITTANIIIIICRPFTRIPAGRIQHRSLLPTLLIVPIHPPDTCQTAEPPSHLLSI